MNPLITALGIHSQKSSAFSKIKRSQKSSMSSENKSNNESSLPTSPSNNESSPPTSPIDESAVHQLQIAFVLLTDELTAVQNELRETQSQLHRANNLIRQIRQLAIPTTPSNPHSYPPPPQSPDHYDGVYR